VPCSQLAGVHVSMPTLAALADTSLPLLLPACDVYTTCFFDDPADLNACGQGKLLSHWLARCMSRLEGSRFSSRTPTRLP
jgi:hypothetical protein